MGASGGYKGGRPHRAACPIITCSRAPTAWLFHAVKTYVATPSNRERNWLRRRRQRADARPARDPDRRRAARQAQADVHAAHRHRRLRRRRQRREDRGHRQQARGQDVLPPLRLPGRPQGAHAQRHARAPARRGHPPRGQGHAAPQPPRAQAADEAQGLRGPGASARGAEAAHRWRSRPDGRRPYPARGAAGGDPGRGRGAGPRPRGTRSRGRRRGDAGRRRGAPAAAETPAAPEETPAAQEAPADEAAPQGDPVAAAAGATPAASGGEDLEEDFVDETPRVKPEIPGVDLEVDIVARGRRAAATAAYGEDDDGRADGRATPRTIADDQPIAAVTIDLAAGARYRATGKRKTAVARVILRPGHRRVHDQRQRRSTSSSRAPRCSATIRQPLETVGYETRMDVIARMHGGGVSAQAGALRHGISPRAARGRPEPARRAQAPRLPDARRARQGAQEGRPQEGPQAAAVLQALVARGADAAPPASSSAPTASAASRASSSPPSSRSRSARAATARVSAPTRAARVLVIRDTRESGEMLEAALAAGVAAAGGEVAARRRPADARPRRC